MFLNIANRVLANERVLATLLNICTLVSNRQKNVGMTKNIEQFKSDFEEWIKENNPWYNVLTDLKRYVDVEDDSPDHIKLLHKALILYDVKWSENKALSYNVDFWRFAVGIDLSECQIIWDKSMVQCPHDQKINPSRAKNSIVIATYFQMAIALFLVIFFKHWR